MIFDNAKLAVIFVILFLIIVSAAFLILRTRISSQNQVTQTEVITVATPTTEVPKVVTPTSAPVKGPAGTFLPRTAFPVVLTGILSLVIAGVGLKLRKFPQ